MVLEGKSATFTVEAPGASKIYWTLRGDGQETLPAVDRFSKSDAWVNPMPGREEKPVAGQFYARDNQNEGVLHYNGALTEIVESVFLKTYADGALYKTETLKPGSDQTFAFNVKLKPGLIKYKVEFGTTAGGKERVTDTVDNLVCGDAYIIEGQSNALATDTGEKSPPETNQWIRSYGRPSGNAEEDQRN